MARALMGMARYPLTTMASQQKHYAIIRRYYVKTSFWRNYVKMTSFRRYNDVINNYYVMCSAGCSTLNSLQLWRHNERDCVSNHQPHDCLLNRLRKHQSSASLAFVRGIHRCPVNSPHKGPVTRKVLPFDDVIMSCSSPYEIPIACANIHHLGIHDNP